MRPRPAARSERFRGGLRSGRSDRIGRGWPARPLGDPQHLPVHEDEQGRSNKRGDREALASSLPSTRVSVVAHCRRKLQAAARWQFARGRVASIAVAVAVLGVPDVDRMSGARASMGRRAQTTGGSSSSSGSSLSA